MLQTGMRVRLLGVDTDSAGKLAGIKDFRSGQLLFQYLDRCFRCSMLLLLALVYALLRGADRGCEIQYSQRHCKRLRQLMELIALPALQASRIDNDMKSGPQADGGHVCQMLV